MPAFYHEDDFGQVEVLPRTCWNFCADRLELIAKHGRVAQAPQPAAAAPAGPAPSPSQPASVKPQALRDLGIRVDALMRVMPRDLAMVPEVTTGHGAHRHPAPRTRAFLAADRALLFASWDEDEVVSTAWHVPCALTPDQRRLLVKTLESVGRLGELMLVDWRGKLVDLADAAAIQAYAGV
jgi:hypothetical protein